MTSRHASSRYCRPPLLFQISAGEPLLLSYGSLTNDYLLLDYGFVVPGNPHDAVTLRYDVGLLQVRRGQATPTHDAAKLTQNRTGRARVSPGV